MKRTIWGFLLFFTFVTVCFAQQNDSNTDEKNGGKVILKAGTQISAQLQNTLDVETAKGNDDLVLKLTEDISSGDFTITKGSELLGGVVSAKKAADDKENSEIIIYFDFLKSGEDYLPFKAIVISIASTGKTSELQFVPSPFFKGATIISAKGKILRIEEGQIFQLKLDKDLTKP
jgi:hypothetical protein